METESRVKAYRDNLAFWLESLSGQLSSALENVVAPYDFTWVDIGILIGVRDAEEDLPLTRLLYPSSAGGAQSQSGQQRFQRFKDAGMVTVKHSEDSPVVVQLTKVGSEYLNRVEKGYSELQKTLSSVVSDQFLSDLKAIQKAL